MVIEHWTKKSQRDLRNYLLQFIHKHQPVTFKELLTEFKISPATLSAHLKALVELRRIEQFTDPKQRNRRPYRTTEKAFDQVRALQVVDFVARFPKETLATMRLDEHKFFITILLSGVPENQVIEVRKELKERWGERSGIREKLMVKASKFFVDYCKHTNANKAVFIVGVDTS